MEEHKDKIQMEKELEKKLEKFNPDKKKLEAVKKFGIFKWIKIYKLLCRQCKSKLFIYNRSNKMIDYEDICVLCRKKAEIILRK